MELLFLPAAGATAPANVRCRASCLLCPAKPTAFSVSLTQAAELSRLRLRRLRRLRLSATDPATTISALDSSSTSVGSVAAPAKVEVSLDSATPNARWMVVMEKPPAGVGSSRAEIIDYYVGTLAGVLGSEKRAQTCIYDASWEHQFGFSCEIDYESSQKLVCLPGILSVRPDTDEEESGKKDYSYSNPSLPQALKDDGSSPESSSSAGSSEYWIVRMEKPGVEVVTKAQMVDYYAQALTKVLRNENDAQVCIYHISWEKDFGFCCHIDEECARELADVPGVLSIRPDLNFGSEKKDYKGDNSASTETNQAPNIRTKRLFVTGLSFYTSEKTLRAAFESFGELVEVKIIMDKISKRSKGYAFLEYTTEEAAAAALKEMNGKIINGWMIVVDVARTNPPKYSRVQSRPSSSSAPSY